MTKRNWLESSTLGPDEVLQVLPHRYPFLMVDRVLEIKTAKPLKLGMTDVEINDARKGSFARAIKNVTFNEAQFQGHFPENPIFPGVLSMEAMAQAAAFVTVPFVAAMHGGDLPRLGVVLAGFDGVRFRRPIRPGDQMDMRVTATHCRGQLWTFEGQILIEGKKAAEGNFLAHLSAGGMA
ncbi:MAG: 3-hydroxyacyl-ACP dehydratase FabZ [Deltaproteobacteria bacterium]|nr:3-hydroxyacyl-ACP dehydratase FabZ [Deltaproteobacteria bacterium]